MFLSTFFGRNTTNHICTIFNSLSRMEGSLREWKASLAIYENADISATKTIRTKIPESRRYNQYVLASLGKIQYCTSKHNWTTAVQCLSTYLFPSKSLANDTGVFIDPYISTSWHGTNTNSRTTTSNCESSHLTWQTTIHHYFFALRTV